MTGDVASIIRMETELLTLEKGFSVYAHDKHFPIMAGVLGVILYQPGYNSMFNPEFE